MPGMAEVMSVALKLPMFYEERPEMWFHFAESQFQLRRITEEQTQFDHIWQSLTTSQAIRVESLMANPPKTGKVNQPMLGFDFFKDNQGDDDRHIMPIDW